MLKSRLQRPHVIGFVVFAILIVLLGVYVGVNIEHFKPCDGFSFHVPIHVETGIGINTGNPADPFVLVPYESIYINRKTELAFGPNTIVLIRGSDLHHATTLKKYSCTNRIYYAGFTADVPDNEQQLLEEIALSWVENGYCLPSMDCYGNTKYVIIENDQIVKEGWLFR